MDLHDKFLLRHLRRHILRQHPKLSSAMCKEALSRLPQDFEDSYPFCCGNNNGKSFSIPRFLAISKFVIHLLCKRFAAA